MRKKTSFFLAVIAVILTFVAVWYVQRPVKPRQATWDDVLAEASSGGYRIISTEELSVRYSKNASDLLLIDTRQEWEYRTGHIKGALNFPMEPTRWARWRKTGELKAFLKPDKGLAIIFY